MRPREIKKLQARSRHLIARVVAPNTLVVASRSNPNSQHIVTLDYRPNGTIYARCTCPWAQNGGFGCSHVMAALNHLAAKQQRSISFWPEREMAERQKHRMLRLKGAEEQDRAIYITTRPA
jgi:uncharacterized Zn finger protein